MGEWILIGVLFVCFGVINRWALQRDLAAAKRWSDDMMRPCDEVDQDEAGPPPASAKP